MQTVLHTLMIRAQELTQRVAKRTAPCYQKTTGFSAEACFENSYGGESRMSSPEPIKFTDGAAYERFMAPWSRSAGALFLDWLAVDPGLTWVDVGCGNGAFTEMIL